MNIKRLTAKKIILVTLLLVICFAFWPSKSVQAEEEKDRIEFVPQITIPSSSFVRNKAIFVSHDTLPKYIDAIYKYGISVTAVLSVIMLMLGGFRWIFAGGDSGAIGAAKNTIKGSLIGLTLVLCAVLLLKTINPALINISLPKTEKPNINLSGCPGMVTSCNDINLLSPPNNAEKERYIKKYGDAWWKGYQMEMCNKQIYVDKCKTLPEALCYWGTQTDSYESTWRYMKLDNNNKQVVDSDVFCRSVLDKPCDTGGLNDKLCKVKYADFDPVKTGITPFSGSFTTQEKQLACNTDGTNRCSLGVVGSRCNNSDECGYADKVKLVCQTCGDNRCVMPLQKGQECGQNDECSKSGLSGNCKGNSYGLQCGTCE